MRSRDQRSSVAGAFLLLLVSCGNDDDEGSGGATGGQGGAGAAGAAQGGASTGAGGSAAGAGNAGKSGSSGGGGSTGNNQPAGTAGAGAEDGSGGSDGAPLGFFVSSDDSMTGMLGGLTGADARCQELADAVGASSRTWRAYLSVEQDPANGGQPTHARDRIGTGPWYNANGVLLAADLTALHALTGDAELFVDEVGQKVPGQWEGSPAPNEHDILTGSNADGTVMEGMTCADWTSDADDLSAQVGHSDGLGPGMNPDPPYSSWNSSHANESCADTAPRGGAGRIYCFAAD